MAIPFFMISRMQLLFTVYLLAAFRASREFSKEKLGLFNYEVLNYDVQDGEVVMGFV
jgi:hypothetical protein